MKSRLTCILLSIAATFACAQPKLQVADGNKFDIGTVYRGSVVEHPLTIQNAGTDSLFIEKVETSCGCTGTMMSNERIGPGSNGTLVITFNSRNFSGKIHKTVTVSSNDPDSPHTLIEFEGMVVDEVMLAPDQLWFQDGRVGRAAEQTVTVRNGGKDPLELSGARTDLEGFSLLLPKDPIPPGATAEMTARFVPQKAAPLLVEGVFIKTSNTRQPEIFLPIYGSVTGTKGK